MSAIWKYPLEITDRQTLLLPRGYDILSVAIQNEQVMLWARVQPDAERVNRTIRIAGTGHPIEDDTLLRFIGTVLTRGGQLVWHVFEELDSPERSAQ